MPFELLPELGAATVTVTASLGLAQYPDSSEDAVLLLKLADDAMYAAKRAGKSRVCFAPDAIASPAPKSTHG